MTNAMISSEEAQSYQSKGLSPRRRTYEVGMRGLLYLSAGITCLLLLFLIGYILYRGLPNLNWTFLTSQESVLRGTDGIMPAIQNTLYVIVVTLIFILPLGVGAAIYLTEYASNHKLVVLRYRLRDSGRHPLLSCTPWWVCWSSVRSWTWARPCWPAPSPWSS